MKTTLTYLGLSLAIAAGAVLTLRSDQAQAQDAPVATRASQPADGSAMSRELEVMRRILLQQGLGVGSSRTEGAHGAYLLAVGRSFGRGSGAAEAFYVGGDGATFVLRTSDPVTPPAAATSSETKPAETLWDEMMADVEGRPRRSKARTTDKFDADKVRALEDRVLTQLARYGGRMTQLDSAEHVTVIVVGGANTLARDTLTDVRVVDDKGNPLEVAAWGNSTTHPFYGRTGSGNGPATVLTMRLAVSDVRAAQRSGGTADTLRSRAVINRY